MIFDNGTHLIEHAYYIAPDSTATNGVESAQYPLFGGHRALLSWQDIGMAPINYLQDRGPFQNGVSVRDFRLNPRVITVELFDRGCQRLDFWCNEAELIQKIRPNRSSVVAAGKLLLIKPDNTEIEIDARLLEGPTGNWDGTGGTAYPDFREQLRFFCADPVWRLPSAAALTYSLVETAACLSSCLSMSLSSASFSETQTINYGGTWEGDQITITITGPLINPEIINDTTGESINLDYSVVAGETVTIAILPDIVTVENQNGINLIGTVSDLSNLVTFALATIGDLTSTGINSISVFGSGGLIGTSQVVFTFFTRHISAFAPC